MKDTTIVINNQPPILIKPVDNPPIVIIPNNAPGPPGPPGFSGMTFVQSTPSSIWTINHNLGFSPSVDLYTTGGLEMLATVHHTSLNQTLVTFNGEPIAGFARLS